jgi:hypothetical protein
MKKKKDEPAGLTGTILSGSIDLSNITSTSTYIIQSSKTLRETHVINNEEGNFIELIYEETMHNYFYVNGASPDKRMIKERYGVKDGKLQIIKTIYGTETPGYYVPPSIEWEE